MMKTTAAQLMTHDVHTVAETATVRDLLKKTHGQLQSGVPIVDAAGRAVGLISQNDLSRALATAAGEVVLPGRHKTAVFVVDEILAAAGMASPPGLDQLLGRPVKDLMTPVVWSVGPDATLAEICDLLVERRIHRVVVCDEARRVLGIVSALDVVGHLRDELRAEG
jgi:CBS domain-containing protein